MVAEDLRRERRPRRIGGGVSAPTVIDAFVRVESIRVDGRHRKDLGAIDALARSIEDVGLLNPITLTRDGRLVAGERRLAACRSLGWAEVPVRFIDSLDDAARLLRAERDENTERKDMLPSEKASLGAALEAIESQGARQRQRDHAGTAPGRNGNTQGTGTPSVDDRTGKTTEAVGEALGMAGRTYQELAYVHRIATDEGAPLDERTLAQQTLVAMDRTGSIAPNARKLRGALRAKHDAQEAKAAALAEPQPEPKAAEADELWVPTRTDASKRAVEQRRKLIRQFGAKGYTAEQIGKRVSGMTAEGVRKVAREEGIDLPGEQVIARTRRIDSNRIVRETAYALDGLAMGVQHVNIAELDPAEVVGWASSMTDSIRVLNRLVKALKEAA